MIIVGTDNTGKVLLISEADSAAAMPTDFNGVAIKAYALTPVQVTAYRALPDRKSLMFDGTTFTATPPDPPPPPIDLSNIDNLDRALKALGLCVAQIGGLTVPQMKTLFKSKWDSLP